ncbi:hypothetical protein GCM10010124_07080 [Pilimelia terevasa]|uniref:Uncharacterized protein n=1 Tax=Pilimelia terevasa TaxID=53372 RepID=A0A8J3BL76_9ACTN|nr:hypothetical protein [Pilimelia terevasa]GGK17128.1 hypothetical protein GCM10010124_07080 [Pilimelia terevasa]
MVDRVVVAVLEDVGWTPPGVPSDDWRAALAEDAVDLVSTLAGVRVAVAVHPARRALAQAVTWPGTTVYALPELAAPAVLAAAAADGATHAALVGADLPDLPALLVGKLLRPLTTRPVAVAPADGADQPAGLAGLACALPAPAWLPAAPLTALSVAAVRAAAPRPGQVAVSAGWRRLRGPADLATLTTALAGAEATRALLAAAAG